MPTPAPSPRTTLRRRPQRGVYDAAVVRAIVDEAPFCHVGFVDGGVPVVIPTVHARVGDTLVLHGAAANRMLVTLRDGGEVCVTVTLLDGLVLARSAFHHSMNYRSVVVFGRASEVTDPGEKVAALRAIVEHLVPGRWDEVRPPTAAEMAGTLVVSLPLLEASAKVRTGAPIDDEEDYALPVWAGELPLRTVPSAPVPDPRLAAGVSLPSSLRRYLDR